LLEKEFTIDVAFRTKARLEERGFKVVLTRTTDDYVALPERPALAGRAGAELFVSIHFNATTSPEVRGLESYILTPQFQRSTGSDVLRPDDEVAVPGNVHDAWSAYLGYTLHRTLLADLRLPDRGLKRARFAVLRDLPCPGLLLEGGYLSNPDDAALIASEGYRERLAAAIANGIDVFNQALRRLEAVRAAGPARRET
jgi:N-acetylmuramoyl-L-alanine amidase